LKYSWLLHLVLFMVIITISACGRKGDPRPPEKITNNVVWQYNDFNK